MKDAPAQAGGARRRVDWRLAARLLAQGNSPEEAASAVGCAASTLKRRLRQDPAFRSEADDQRLAALPDHLRLEALRRQLHKAIESEVRQGNVRVILWLADRMKIIQPDKANTPEDELSSVIEEMSPDELIEFEGLRDSG